jgi:hypothetical protein
MASFVRLCEGCSAMLAFPVRSSAPLMRRNRRMSRFVPQRTRLQAWWGCFQEKGRLALFNAVK